MATIIGLPKLSPTMEEGVLAKWARKEGDKVSPGDVIAEVETDKANMDFTLEDEGVLLKLLVAEGDTVKLGSPVAILGQPGEDTKALEGEARAQMAGGAAPAPAPAAAKAEPAPAADKKLDPVAEKAPVEKAAPAAVPKAAPSPAAPQQAAPTASAGRVLASPIARTLAGDHGIDLRSVQGSGPGGRIVERDVLALVGGAPAPAAAPAAATNGKTAAPAATQNEDMPVARPAAPVPAAAAHDIDKPLSMMRKTIARRLVEAKTTIPHFYLNGDCDAAPLLAFRAQLNAVVPEEGKISVNDLIVKACAVALRRMPAVNSAFLGDKIRQFGAVHIGVAVSVEDGLLTPVVRDVDGKGLSRINAEIKDLAGRAKNKKLAPEEMTGSTFTVSNLGMFGIDHFQAIINPPEAVILAVGAVRKQPVVGKNDEIVVGQRMGLTLSCDHRVVDGALGAKFLAELVKILENPQALVL
jgi:pyruvate dehydrogenase E2 component (dihydrolipoamide acetyltransferase)